MKNLFLILLLLSFLVSYSATKTAIITGNWGTAGNWSPNGVPVAGDSVIIPFGITITTNANNQGCYALVVYGTFIADKNNFSATNIYNYGVIISNGNNFQSAGNIINTGSFDVNGNNFTAVNITNSGDMTFDGVNPIVTGEIINTGTITGITMPIELLYFTAQQQKGNKIIIQWSTATETNNDYFLLYKSIDGLNYIQFKKISGSGNSNHILIYKTTDVFEEGLIYYKLRQVDYDGKFEEFITSISIISTEEKIDCVKVYTLSGIEVYKGKALNTLELKPGFYIILSYYKDRIVSSLFRKLD